MIDIKIDPVRILEGIVNPDKKVNNEVNNKAQNNSSELNDNGVISEEEVILNSLNSAKSQVWTDWSTMIKILNGEV